MLQELAVYVDSHSISFFYAACGRATPIANDEKVSVHLTKIKESNLTAC